MDEQKPYSSSYSPRVAASTGFLANLFFIPTVTSALLAGWGKLFHQKEFVSAFKDNFKSKIVWAVAIGFGLWSGYREHKYAKHVKSQNDQLLQDNIQMRSQLNETGVVLSQVAQQIERGSTHAAKIDRPAATHHEQAQADKLAAEQAAPTLH